VLKLIYLGRYARIFRIHHLWMATLDISDQQSVDQDLFANEIQCCGPFPSLEEIAQLASPSIAADQFLLGQFTFLPATWVGDRNSLETFGRLSHASCGEQLGQGIPAAPHPQQCVPVNGLLG
jgi:hypothetical protein